uniref:Uncharacterized protein n=1 Tax=Oryza meridionalis TaxID=40149 RepID=A0A0E0FBJ4_9ORYZ
MGQELCLYILHWKPPHEDAEISRTRTGIGNNTWKTDREHRECKRCFFTSAKEALMGLQANQLVC